MDRKQIEDELIGIIQNYAEVDRTAILNGAPLDQLVDSMAFLEIIFDAEDKFGISVEDEDVKSLKTFEDVVRGIESLIAAKA